MERIVLDTLTAEFRSFLILCQSYMSFLSFASESDSIRDALLISPFCVHQ
jgi:hypothetical protein